MKPGPDESPLPAPAVVLRLCEAVGTDYAATGKVHPKAFELSNRDKEGARPHLSVWAEEITPPSQAKALMGRDVPMVACRLVVGDVRHLRPHPDELPNIENLDVTWEPAMRRIEEEDVRDDRPGSEGHAGILGLVRPKGEPRKYRKSYLSQLADLASRPGCTVNVP